MSLRIDDQLTANTQNKKIVKNIVKARLTEPDHKYHAEFQYKKRSALLDGRESKDRKTPLPAQKAVTQFT